MTTAKQQLEIDEDIKEFGAFQRRVVLPQMAKNFLPRYNPGRKPTRHGLLDYLRQFEPGGSMARSAAPAS